MIDLFNVVKECGVFKSLDDGTLREWLPRFEKMSLSKNKFLFYQGDPSDSVYLLVSGKLLVILTKDNNQQKIIAEIEPGEIIGEMSALTGEVRGSSVKVLVDAVMLKLSTQQFQQLCQDYPAVLQATVKTLVTRSRMLLRQLSTDKPLIKHIVILPANKHVKLDKLYDAFSANLKLPQITIVSPLNPEFSNLTDTKALREDIAKREQNNETLVYLLDLQDTILTSISFELLDMIYIVGNGDERPHLDHYVSEKLKIYESKFKPELLLLHNNDELPHGTNHWLRLARFGLQHHIRIHNEKDWQRVSRFIRGQAIGLVLGGGGVRSWAHLGVIRALEEANIPIDAIGGVSAGAIVAGYYALYESSHDAQQKLHQLTVSAGKAASLSNLTWPAVSFFNGTDYTKTLKKVYGKTRITNLWLPFFCLTCNISNIKQVVLRKGILWKAIRSSTAVPAIFPPVVIKGHLHLDGGIINNLPVDVMRNLSNGIGPIIASELVHKFRDDTKYHFPTSLPFWKVVLAKLGIAYRYLVFPSFINMFLKSLLAGSSARQAENASKADVLVRPDLSDFELLKISHADEKALFEIGYQTTKVALKNWEQNNDGFRPL